MRKENISIFFIAFLIISTVAFGYINTGKEGYLTDIVSYTENGSYIEYPQIQGLRDENKQKDINKLLKAQVLLGTKNYLNKPFVDFSYPNYKFYYKSGVGLANKYIASFWYSFNGYGEAYLEDGGVIRDTYKFYGITIDMSSGEEISLTDFMKIDERLINSSDGTNKETSYNSAVNPKFHNFKDVFMIYTSEGEKDTYHIFTPDEIIDMLKDLETETNWYIDENKNIVFHFEEKYVNIPFSQISNSIYPKYLNALKK